jgi:beta-hydroxylase
MSAPNDSLQEQQFTDRNDTVTKKLVRKAIHSLDWLFGTFSKIGDRPIHDDSDFDWSPHLKAHWTEIRDEVDDLLQYRDALPTFHDIAEDAATISQDDKWKTFFLYGYGEKEETNCARCPRTTELVEQIPGMVTAFFSILAPGKHIPPHRGPYKGVIRYHLGLKVPEPAEKCRIRVADRVTHWEEGEAVVFDDTYNHEVWNETDGERVVLFLDVKRPLPRVLDAFNSLLLEATRRSSIVKNAQENQNEWSERLKEAEARAQRTTDAPAPAEAGA